MVYALFQPPRRANSMREDFWFWIDTRTPHGPPNKATWYSCPQGSVPSSVVGIDAAAVTFRLVSSPIASILSPKLKSAPTSCVCDLDTPAAVLPPGAGQPPEAASQAAHRGQSRRRTGAPGLPQRARHTAPPRVAQLLLGHSDLRTRVGYREGRRGTSVRGPLLDPRDHYLHSRAIQMRRLLDRPQGWRPTSEMESLRAALNLREHINTYLGPDRLPLRPLQTRTLKSLISDMELARQASRSRGPRPSKRSPRSSGWTSANRSGSSNGCGTSTTSRWP